MVGSARRHTVLNTPSCGLTDRDLQQARTSRRRTMTRSTRSQKRSSTYQQRGISRICTRVGRRCSEEGWTSSVLA